MNQSYCYSWAEKILRCESGDLQWEETVQEAEVWRAGIDLY